MNSSPSTGVDGEPLPATSSIVLRGRAASAAEARRFVAGVLADLALPIEASEAAELESSLALVVSELVANAVNACPGEDVELRVGVTGRGWPTPGPTARSGGVVVTVINRHGGSVPPPRDQWALASPQDTSGRGLFIVDHVSDAFDIVTANGRIEATAIVGWGGRMNAGSDATEGRY